MNSVSDADLIVITDTGSTDGTQDKLRERGAIVFEKNIEPWSFSEARNKSLEHVPDDVDICICLDIDEVLVPGWREEVEKAWKDINRLNYIMVHSWKDKERTQPDISFWGFKIHSRKNWQWVEPIHEYLEFVPSKDCPEEKADKLEKVLVHHYQETNKKARQERIGMMEKAARDNSESSRLAHIYARELFLQKRFAEAIPEFKRHLDITKPYGHDSQIRAMSCHYIAYALIATSGNAEDIMTWFLRAVSESPGEREHWMYLAEAWLDVGDPGSAYGAVTRAMSIDSKVNSCEINELYWTDFPERVAKITLTNILKTFEVKR